MKRYNRELMLPLYEQWQASGQSKKAFAISRHINHKTFYYWANKIERASVPSSSGFQRIEAGVLSVGAAQGELMAAVQYPSGVRLELYSSFQQVSPSYTRLLKTLIS